ncbi:MAG: AAA family ATPase [Actinobacteria bacterium]|nr:AAA family ATPase [Actinomycetota bacterium]
MSPVGDKEGSLTRHFMLADIPGAVAAMPQPATLADAQAALDSVGNQHGALAARLFAFEGVSAEQTPTAASAVLEDAMVTACRNHDPAALLLVWCALVMADHRVGDAVENFLTGSDGKLDASHFDGTQLEQYLSARGVGSADKAASNLLRWFETAGLVVPRRHGPTIIGFDQQLPTAHAAAGLAQLVADRMAAHRLRPAPGADPVALALGIGANRWLNLTPGEFEAAAKPPPQLGAPTPRPAVPAHLAELHRELYRKGQVILQGPPGTGKTYLAHDFVSWFTAALDGQSRLATLVEGLPDHERTPRRVAEVAANMGLAGVWDIVQFHPSLTYDDFVRSLRAEPVAGGVTFVPTNRIFGFVCEVGRHLASMGAAVEVLLLIDEINRADISKVLGELIYGLEYRDEPVTTPYVVDGSASLVVPKNLYVVGTMNTADRSIALIDYALRRRFVYLDVTPDRGVISGWQRFAGQASQDGALALFDAATRLFEGSAELRTIQVGHSYFLSDGAATVDDDADVIARRFAYEVVPLLFEYEAEGRFQALGLDALFDDLALVTRPLDGAVNQIDLVAEVRDRILAGTLGPAPPAAPAATTTAVPAAPATPVPAPADTDEEPAPASDDNTP